MFLHPFVQYTAAIFIDEWCFGTSVVVHLIALPRIIACLMMVADGYFSRPLLQYLDVHNSRFDEYCFRRKYVVANKRTR